jgi:anti-sigma-K factor RskA
MTDQRDPRSTDLTCDEVGDLAASYVLGALDPDEAAAVRAHLAACPEAHDEFAELASVLPVLADSVPIVEPPASLGPRIRAAAEAEVAAAATQSPAATPPAVDAAVATEPIAFPDADARETRAAERRRSTPATTWLLRIAAVLAIGVLGGWNLVLQGQLAQAEAYEQAVTAVLDAAGEPGALTAVLTTESGTGPSGLAAVSPDGQVTLAMQGLQPTTGSEVYETWVIAGDGPPVAIGGFTVGPDGRATFDTETPPVEPGIVLALTLEPQAGMTAPTGPVVSSGTASAG